MRYDKTNYRLVKQYGTSGLKFNHLNSSSLKVFQAQLSGVKFKLLIDTEIAQIN